MLSLNLVREMQKKKNSQIWMDLLLIYIYIYNFQD